MSRSRLLLECRGVVQGVGFRPAVHRLAAELKLEGDLTNHRDGVRLDLRGPRPALERFLQRLPTVLPPAARLEAGSPRWLPAAAAGQHSDPAPPPLRIRAEAERSQPLRIGLVARSLVADRAPCRACRAEQDDPGNRRHGDPFLSCPDCGPRYSIATAEPWSRAHTTLAAFRPCADCAAEGADPDDRRFHAETISCPRCGPRLSLLLATGVPLPTGRKATGGGRDRSAIPRTEGHQDTTRGWTGTAAAGRSAPADLHSLAEPPPAGRSARDHHAALIEAAAQLLEAGAILALQGVGGFQLLVDADDGAAVARLRRRKQRPSRPFALLVADPEEGDPEPRDAPGAAAHSQRGGWRELEERLGLAPVSAAALAQLRAAAAPIVLLPRRQPARDPEGEAAVAPGSPHLGLMLPASPLHRLLARRVGRPLVCTSGNRSGEPLCTDPAEALQRLAGIADAFLLHDRPIARPLDDSVLQLIEAEPCLLRRARGFAPEPLRLPVLPSSRSDEAAAAATVLALGGDLKCAPALAVGERIWPAPHLGDLAEARVARRLREGVGELLQQEEPWVELVACDRHPGYLSHQMAASLRPPLHTVQHHHAHALAVVAERGLTLPVLALCADGLGYGEPPSGRRSCGTPPESPLWGGELLRIGATGAVRLASLRPLRLPGAERAIAEPRRVALAMLAAAGPRALAHPGARHTLEAFSAGERSLLLQALESGVNAPTTSALGRLFDGVASLLGLCQRLSHEGEGGLRLQGAAVAGLGAPAQADATWAGAATTIADLGLPLRADPSGDLPLGRLDWMPLLTGLLEGNAAGLDPRILAARFHRDLAESLAGLAATAAAPGCSGVVLAGGCFQNGLLLESTIVALRRQGLRPHWPAALPASDGGLALGQIQAARLAARPAG